MTGHLKLSARRRVEIEAKRALDAKQALCDECQQEARHSATAQAALKADYVRSVALLSFLLHCPCCSCPEAQITAPMQPVLKSPKAWDVSEADTTFSISTAVGEPTVMPRPSHIAILLTYLRLGDRWTDMASPAVTCQCLQVMYKILHTHHVHEQFSARVDKSPTCLVATAGMWQSRRLPSNS